MRDAGKDAAGVLARAQRRRRLQTAIGCGAGLVTASIGVIGLVLYLAGRAGGVDALRWGPPAILLALVAAFVLTRLVWRCPACDKPLGTEGPLLPGDWRVCPWCGARLAVDPNGDS